MNLLGVADQAEFAVDSLDVSNGHLEVPLARLHGAELVWLNDEEAKDDPIWDRLAGNRNAYIKHLLSACAYKVVVDGRIPDRVGIADRYGGGGIGSNGGSGRSVMVGSYYVKGVGQTPLIGHGAHPDHVTGGAYLEECVRESILAEILHLELPYGTVRTLAIITTGDIQVWRTESGLKPERCCLLVRRAFLRPAHIERAALFRGNGDLPGMADAHRVRRMISTLEVHAGGTYLLQEQLIAGLVRWSRQLAASYLQCLPHGGVSSSNVTIDGRLVDFGATAGVPSLARYWVGGGRHPSGEEVQDIVNTINGIACAFRFTAGKRHSIDTWVTCARDRVLRAYSDGLQAMLLYLLGFSVAEVQDLLTGKAGQAISQRLDRWLGLLRRRVWPTIEGISWDLHAMPDLCALDALKADLVRIACDAGAKTPELPSDAAEERLEDRLLWLAPRIRLDHDHLKDEVYARVDCQHLRDADLSKIREAISDVICGIVERESRVRLEPLRLYWSESISANGAGFGGWSQSWSFKFEQSRPGHLDLSGS